MKRKHSISSIPCLLLAVMLSSTALAAEHYVSPAGDDANVGSQDSPWATIPHAMTQAAPGDTVFVRGGIYRTAVLLSKAEGSCSGEEGKPITIKAYADETPCIFNSRAFDDPSDWTPAGENIWKTSDGAVTGYDVGCVWRDDEPSEKKWALDDLAEPWDFYFDPDAQAVYLRAEGNPGELCDSIEIPIGKQWEHAVRLRGVSHVTLDGLTIKYTNTHGVQFSGCHHVTVRNCHISHGGGAWIWIDDNGEPTRFGNAVELYGGGNNILVENCAISHFFDTGITNQGNEGDQYNITYRNNTISHTKCGLEHWVVGPSNVRDVLWEGNTITDSGDNWARNMQNVWGAVRVMRLHPNGLYADSPDTGVVERFVVRNNTIIRCGSKKGAQTGEPRLFKEHPSIRAKGGPYIIENNVVRDSPADGIYASDGFHGVLRGNTIEGSAWLGIRLEDVSDDAVIENNTLRNNEREASPN